MPDEETTTVPDATTPADWKVLLADILKGKGLEIAEDAAVNLVRQVYKALPEIAKIIPGELDDYAVSIFALTEPKILAMLDKIDGIDDPDY